MKESKGAFFFLLFVLSFTSLAFAAGRPRDCTDVPISWYFEPVTTNNLQSAIYNDDKGIYKQGVDGVTSRINFCGYGSKDGTLNLIQSKSRILWIKFAPAISGSIIESGPPSFAGGNPLATKAFVNVRNLVGFPQVTTGTSATYYTKMSVSFGHPKNSPHNYNLAFLPFDDDCPSGLDCVDSPTSDVASPNQNAPNSAGWVKVVYSPRDLNQPWSSSNTDQWIVEGEFPVDTDLDVQRGTLLSAGVHMGQNSMPFRIRITALAPLP